MLQRTLIYEKAISLFIELGYDNTPISLIAKELGVTKAGLYHYFPSKERLLYELHDYYLKRDFIPILDVAEKISDPSGRIRYFIENYTRVLARDPAVRVLIHEARRLAPEHLERVKGVWRRAYGLLKKSILELQASGCNGQINPAFAAFAAIGMCSWTFYWFDYSRKASAEELAGTFTDLFFHGLLHAQAPGKASNTP